MPSANTQAQIDAAAAAHEELARRVAQADAAAAHGPRMLELQAMVDGFAAADRQFLQLPGGTKHAGMRRLVAITLWAGMANWERGYIHEYAGTKGLHHPTTEVCASLLSPHFTFWQPCALHALAFWLMKCLFRCPRATVASLLQR